MLPNEKRLRSGDFKVKKQILKKVENAFFSSVLSKKNEENPRFAVVISGKVTKSKPKRNQLKRRVFEALKSILVHKTVKYDVIIYPKKEALKLDFKGILKEIEVNL